MEKLLNAADKGDINAQYLLGNIYYMGIGVEQDFVAAEGWFKKAYLNGHSGAKLYLEIMYENELASK